MQAFHPICTTNQYILRRIHIMLVYLITMKNVTSLHLSSDLLDWLLHPSCQWCEMWGRWSLWAWSHQLRTDQVVSSAITSSLIKLMISKISIPQEGFWDDLMFLMLHYVSHNELMLVLWSSRCSNKDDVMDSPHSATRLIIGRIPRSSPRPPSVSFFVLIEYW